MDFKFGLTIGYSRSASKVRSIPFRVVACFMPYAYLVAAQ